MRKLWYWLRSPTLRTVRTSRSRYVCKLAVLLLNGCHFVDPQCFVTPGLGAAARRHAPALRLELSLPNSARPDFVRVDRAGRSLFVDSYAGISACQRLKREQIDRLTDLWTGTDLSELANRECGAGWCYHSTSAVDECRESRWEPHDRWCGLARNDANPPYISLSYHADDEPVGFSWDLEAELPKQLQAALAGTVEILCDESGPFRRKIRGRLPNLAALANC